MKHFLKYDGGREADYKPNKKNIGDCVIRAIAIGLDQTYKTTLKELCELAVEMGGLPNSQWVYEPYLYSKGYQKHKMPKYANGKRYKVKRLKEKNVLVHTRKHLTAVVDNTVKDTWDTREQYCFNYYTKVSPNLKQHQ